jgi:hypothetical protein
MTAAPSSALVWEVAAFDALPDYPSSTPAGINGDQSHFGANTYHIGISELPNPGGYTNRTWEDKMPAAGSSWHSSATDESMSTADMVKNWNRHLVVFNDSTDPRRQYIAEYIGWNGVGEAERLDFQANTRTVASSDHKWHRHRAKRRRFYNSMEAAKACISIDKGETKQQYQASIGQAPAVTTTGGQDDMSMVHKTVSGVTTYAVVTPGGWTEILPPNQNTANAVSVATGASIGYATPEAYDAAKNWWNANVVPANTSAGVTDAQAAAMADKIAAAVVASDTNELTEADLASVTEAVKQAFREGTV